MGFYSVVEKKTVCSVKEFVQICIDSRLAENSINREK